VLADLRREMAEASAALEFERAAELRDRIRALETERLAAT
jgi:excinuclease UvrABC nuclease subunit